MQHTSYCRAVEPCRPHHGWTAVRFERSWVIFSVCVAVCCPQWNNEVTQIMRGSTDGLYVKIHYWLTQNSENWWKLMKIDCMPCRRRVIERAKLAVPYMPCQFSCFLLEVAHWTSPASGQDWGQHADGLDSRYGVGRKHWTEGSWTSR